MQSSVPTAFPSAAGPAGIGSTAAGSALLPQQPSLRRPLLPDKDADRLLVSVTARKTGDLQMQLIQLVNALREDDDALVTITLSECERLSAPIEQKFFYPRLCADYLLQATRLRSHNLGLLDESIRDIDLLIEASRNLLRNPSTGERYRLSLPPRLTSGASRNSIGGEWPRVVLMAAHCLGFAESSTADGRRQWAFDADCSGPLSVAHQGQDQLAQLVADLRLLASELRRQRDKHVEHTGGAGQASSVAVAETSQAVTSECFTCGKQAAYICRAKGGDGRPRCGDCSEDYHQHHQRRHHEQDGICRPLPPPLPHADSSNGSGIGSSLQSFYGPETDRGRRVVRLLQSEVEDILQRVKQIQDPNDRLRAIDKQLEVVSARTKQLYRETGSSDGAFMSGKYAELLACEQTKDLLAEERRTCLRRLATPSEPTVGGLLSLGSRTSAGPAAPAATHRSLSSPGSLRIGSGSSFLPSPKAGTVTSPQQLSLQPQGSTYTDIVDQLRAAEKAGIRADLVAEALRQIDYDRDRGRGDNAVASSGKVAITNWPMLLQSIRQAAVRNNPIAAAGLTYKELCRAAASNHLNVPNAAQHCVTQRLQLIKVVQELVTIDTAAVAKSLEKHATALESAGGTADLTAPAVALMAGDIVLEPFRQRIWDRPLERPRDDGNDNGSSSGSTSGNSTGGRAADDGSRKLPLSRATRDLLCDRAADQARRARAMLVEGDLRSWMRALNAVQILDENPSGRFALSDVLHAVRECGGVRASLSYLQQDCGTCLCTFPRNRLHELTCTTCQVCSDCLVSYFTIKIREKPVFDFTCPVCGLPDIASDREKASLHFEFLTLILQNCLSKELLDAFQRKLRDYNLMNDPRFCWCAHCSSGYLYEGDPRRQPRTTCPDCKRSMCFSCRKPWEPQHEGLSCDLFAQWKADNDPSMQAEGVAKHLEQNGINCPKCQFRFLLAKGGCMHFTCTQCKHEFCAGCGHEFSHACRKLADCGKKGLHCHHPRNCLYFMRDLTIPQLQKLLDGKSVEYKKALTAQQVEARRKAAHSGSVSTLLCRVMEQKEQASGLKDEACGKTATEEQAGLCEVHYKEYLVHLGNKAHIDPIVLMDDKELAIVLQREGLSVPQPPKDRQKRDQYLLSLRNHVEQNVPLPRLDSFRC